MVERMLILRNETFDEDSDSRDPELSKNQSFNTDDEEHNSEPKVELTPVNTGLLMPASMLTHSASVDTLNDQESLTGDAPVEKVKKKRRRNTEQQPSLFDIGRRAPKKQTWYRKIDFTKPLIYIAVVFIIYLMWVKRDVWIPRLLTSNSRVRYTASINQQKLLERAESHPSPSKDSSNSQQDDDDDDDDDTNNDQTTYNNDDDGPVTSSKSSSPQKLSIRTRRNKMSFGKDAQPKKRRYLKHQIIDGDVDIDDDDAIADDVDVDDAIDGDIGKESDLPSSAHSSKKHRHRRAPKTRKEHSKHPTHSKTSVISTQNEDIVEQLRHLIKSKGRHKDLSATLTKETGLEKSKINRFIHKKDFSIITLDAFVSLLNSFDSKILVVSN